ncbi:hypothetical protein ACH41H_25215 [Streptomyces sp. NPDC020800]|uniref:hypothetical protein n=1 Tax=Streptomyces sp. NPDC020800 TaxID=3365092 RepID=UPI00379E8108
MRLAARSRGMSAPRSVEAVRHAAAQELKSAPVARLPAPRFGQWLVLQSGGMGGRGADPAVAWPAADGLTCLEAEFTAQSSRDASVRLLLVHDWPPTVVRDAAIAHLAASPAPDLSFRSAVVKWATTRRGGGGDTTGPSFSAVIAALGHIVAKLEVEQAAQPARSTRRFAAGSALVGGTAFDEAAEALLRTAFPFLPRAGEPAGAAEAVEEQRHAGEEWRACGLGVAVRERYASWVPDGPRPLEVLAEQLPWQVLRLDVLCGRSGTGAA